MNRSSNRFRKFLKFAIYLKLTFQVRLVSDSQFCFTLFVECRSVSPVCAVWIKRVVCVVQKLFSKFVHDSDNRQIMQIAQLIALMILARLFADFCLEYVVPARRQYREMKYLQPTQR